MARQPQSIQWECKKHKFRTSSRHSPASLEHMETVHGVHGSDMKLYVQAIRVLRRVRPNNLLTSCPLCGTQELRGNELLGHISSHLQRLALISLPALGEKAGEFQNQSSYESSFDEVEPHDFSPDESWSDESWSDESSSEEDEDSALRNSSDASRTVEQEGDQEASSRKRKGRPDSTSSMEMDSEVEEGGNPPRAKRQRPANEMTRLEHVFQIPRRPKKAGP